MKQNDSKNKSDNQQKSILNFFGSSSNKGVKRTYTDMLEGQEDDIKTATQIVKNVTYILTNSALQKAKIQPKTAQTKSIK
jgi:hypothetical protein